MKNSRQLAVIGALLAGTSVALGAYGAHGLSDHLAKLGYAAQLEQRLAWFDTAVRYQFFHALGCLTLGMAGRPSERWLGWVGGLFLLGVLLFSGSLYAMTFASDAWRKLGAVTPLGGMAFLAGWGILAYCVHHNAES